MATSPTTCVQALASRPVYTILVLNLHCQNLYLNILYGPNWTADPTPNSQS